MASVEVMKERARIAGRFNLSARRNPEHRALVALAAQKAGGSAMLSPLFPVKMRLKCSAAHARYRAVNRSLSWQRLTGSFTLVSSMARVMRLSNPKTSRRPGGYYRCSIRRVFSMLMGIVTAEIRIEKYPVTALLLKARTSRYMLG